MQCGGLAPAGLRRIDAGSCQMRKECVCILLSSLRQHLAPAALLQAKIFQPPRLCAVYSRV